MNPKNQHRHTPRSSFPSLYIFRDRCAQASFQTESTFANPHGNCPRIMKFLSTSFALLGGLLQLCGQEKTTPKWDVEIPGPIYDGKPSAPAPKPEPINFKVEQSRTTRMAVTEAPEMPDLPPIKGVINVTVQLVKDPGLPDPPPPLPQLPPDDPAVIARMEEFRQNYRGTELVFLSATVYDHSRTLLRIFPNGKADGEIIAWSNLDFNQFGGFSSYRVTDGDGTIHDCGLLMGIGNENTAAMAERLARYGKNYNKPENPKLPDLAASGPAFLVIDGQADGAAMNTLSQVHELYRKEGVRMEEAFHAKEKAYVERHAYLLAHPPVPENVKIQFWKRDRAAALQQNKERAKGQ